VVQATLSFEALPSSSTRYLGPPSAIVPYLSGPGNQQGLAIGTSSVPYQTGTSSYTGLETGGYSISVTDYCQAVVSRALNNNGILLASAAPQSPERVVLGGPKRAENRMRLTLYFLNE
jgi:hypothetical protein